MSLMDRTMAREQYNFLTRFGGFVAASWAKLWFTSMDLQMTQYDLCVEPGAPTFRGPFIYLFWHEYITMPIALSRASMAAMLVSKHRDADMLCCAGDMLGIKVVRGSTGRGGERALRELARSNTNICITPDGPRGPRRKMSKGPIYLSSRMQIPIVCVGIGYDRPYRMPTWDRFAVPRPGSRCRAIASPPMQMPAKLKRDGIEQYRKRVEGSLNLLTKEAETWSKAHDRRDGQHAPGVIKHTDEEGDAPWRSLQPIQIAEETRAA